MNRLLRKAHTYLGLAVSIQLLLWTVSGIYFAFNDIDDIRGSQYLVDQPTRAFTIDQPQQFPSAKQLSYFYRLEQLLVSVETDSGTEIYQPDGSAVEPLSSAQAKMLVSERTRLMPVEVSSITEAEVGAEYRGRDLPLYRVSARDAEGLVNVYVDPRSGAIVAIRSDAWRTWDLLWGLHIMDWKARDDFGNIFLRFFSILALISALSGILLYVKMRRR